VIAAFGACGVRVDFDITCIDHQPFNAGRRSIVPAAFPTFLCHAGDRSNDNIMPPTGRNGIVFHAAYFVEKRTADQLLSFDDTIRYRHNSSALTKSLSNIVFAETFL
jgi:hypothetical protein